MYVADVVVAAYPFVWAKGLVAFHNRESGIIDVGAQNIPAWREAGLIEDYWPLCIGDYAVMMADYKVTGGLANVDAVVAIGGMAQNPFVFFVEGVHRRPSERYAPLQYLRIGWQLCVLPRSSWRGFLIRLDDVPGSEAEVCVRGGMLGAF